MFYVWVKSSLYLLVLSASCRDSRHLCCRVLNVSKDRLRHWCTVCAVQHNTSGIQPVTPRLLHRAGRRMPRGCALPFRGFPAVAEHSCPEHCGRKRHKIIAFRQQFASVRSDRRECYRSWISDSDGHSVAWICTTPFAERINCCSWRFWQWLLWPAAGRWRNENVFWHLLLSLFLFQILGYYDRYSYC